MDKNKQRVYIAEVCGWRKWTFGDPMVCGIRLSDKRFDGYIRKVTKKFDDNRWLLNIDEGNPSTVAELSRDYIPASHWVSKYGKVSFLPPDYINNLNAMHEAEKTLIDSGRWRYAEYALRIKQMTTGWSFNATAAQRAEAFLRTLGKWEES